MSTDAVRLDVFDWLVIAGYAVGVLVIGGYYNRRNKNTEDYLVGGRNMRPLAVGLSFFVALFSTITYLAIPGEMVRYGPMILAGLAALPLVMLLAGWGLIPVFMRLRVTSGYELLETRLGPSVRMLGVFFFLAMRMMWMGVIIYATVDKVVVPLTGLSPNATPWVCLVVAGLTIAYTTMGGLQAIVMIDAAQATLLFGGIFLSLGIITHHLGGFGGWWPASWPQEWQSPQWVYDSGSGRSILGAFMAVLVWYTCTAGSDQVAIQRYLATRDASAARRMLAVSLIASALIQLLLACLGMALLAYATTHPEWLPAGQTVREAADKLLPRFIISMLPAGISGLIIAGMLSEAMNSLSSGINSVSCVIATDLIGRFRRTAGTAEGDLRMVRWLSVCVGAVVVLMSIGVSYVQGNLLELAYKVVNLLTIPLFGLFFMAIFVRWATPFGTYVGAAVGVFTVAVINYWRELTGQADPPISFLWAMPLSLVLQIATGMLASLLPIGTPVYAREGASLAGGGEDTGTALAGASLDR